MLCSDIFCVAQYLKVPRGLAVLLAAAPGHSSSGGSHLTNPVLFANARGRLLQAAFIFWLLPYQVLGPRPKPKCSRSATLPTLSIDEPATERLHDSATFDFLQWMQAHLVDISPETLVAVPLLLSSFLVAYCQQLYARGDPHTCTLWLLQPFSVACIRP